MKLWTVRAGKHGQQEQTCLDKNLITIGWDELPDLKTFKTRDDLFDSYQKIYQQSNVKAGITVGQIWRFANEITNGDIVALPSKFQPVIPSPKLKSTRLTRNKSLTLRLMRVYLFANLILRPNLPQKNLIFTLQNLV